MKELVLHQIVKEFDISARPESNDPNSPATVADLNRLVTQIAFTLDKLISEATHK